MEEELQVLNADKFIVDKHDAIPIFIQLHDCFY
jgi:hypothetical protein